MSLGKIVDAIIGKEDEKKVKGKVVLMKRNVLDFTDKSSLIVDDTADFLGHKVSFQLISSTHADPG